MVVSSFATDCYSFDGLAILGDSISTGAAANPMVQFDSRSIWAVFNDNRGFELTPDFFPDQFRQLSKDLDRPFRAVPSSRENDGGSGWLWLNTIQAIMGKTLEEHRLSYGYLMGRSLGMRGQDILLAGENGARAQRAWLHASRLIGARKKDLPSKIVMLYSGNDLCAQSYDEISSAEAYGESLLRGMQYLVLNGHVSPRGTRIYLPAFLPVTTLVHEPSILERKIMLHGEETTCREAREKLFSPKSAKDNESEDPLFQIFSSMIPPSPVLLCPTLFAPAAQDSARQAMLANRIRSYREAQRKAVQDFNDWRGKKHPAKSFEAIYLAGTEQIRFDGADVAGDCFHLSAQGQGKVASAILPGLK